MQTAVGLPLGRVAVVLRLIGAVWMLVLLGATGLAGQLQAPWASAVAAGVAVAWAVVAWRMGWIEQGVSWVAVADVAVTSVLIVVPALAGQVVGFSGGYPFASLVVALAVAGRRGVVMAAAALSVATLANLAAVGTTSLSVATTNVLLYALGAVALWMGFEVLARQEARTREAEAALAVADERATTASHLHDSVLQTLALVQRRADQPGVVRSLARRQERELREWLFGETDGVEVAGSGAPPVPARSGPDRPTAGFRRDPGMGEGLRSVLEALAEEVEEQHGVTLGVVTVGGAGDVVVADEPLVAVVAAAREAVVNAAVHAGVDRVDVFAERGGSALAIYVRDRGCGFDLQDVAGDRQGIRGSIMGRVERVGGSVTVDSQPGRGTEVRLRTDLVDG